MSRVDPRLAARRRAVQESTARSRLRRLLLLLALGAGVAAGVWVLKSPWLSLDELVVAGVGESRAVEVLAEQEIVPGRPLITIRAGRLEAALLDDPWVARVDTRVVWPDRLEVQIEERRPVAWLPGEGGWLLVSADGVVLELVEQPDRHLPRARMAAVPAAPGDRLEDRVARGAVEYLAALPGGLARGARVVAEGDELWASVSGFRVRLGRPVDMTEKAVATEAVLAVGQPEGALITVIAPAQPAVFIPGTTGPVPSDDSLPVDEG